MLVLTMFVYLTLAVSLIIILKNDEAKYVFYSLVWTGEIWVIIFMMSFFMFIYGALTNNSTLFSLSLTYMWICIFSLLKQIPDNMAKQMASSIASSKMIPYAVVILVPLAILTWGIVFMTMYNLYFLHTDALLYLSLDSSFQMKAGKMFSNMATGVPYFSFDMNSEDFFEQYKSKLTDMFNKRANKYPWGYQQDDSKYRVMCWYGEMAYKAQEYQCQQNDTYFNDAQWSLLKVEIRGIRINDKSFHTMHTWNDCEITAPAKCADKARIFFKYYHGQLN